MWKYLLICAMVGVASCSGTKGNSDGAGADEGKSATIVAPDIHGQWLIENVVENDSSMKKPFPTFIHLTARDLDLFYISAGRRGLQFEVNPVRVAEYVNARFADIVK